MKMKFQTIDDLRNAQNALKKDIRSALPLPYPLDVEICEPVKPELFYVCQTNLMRAPWSLLVDHANNRCIEYPEIGLELDENTQKEF
jgi:hypothetical protein